MKRIYIAGPYSAPDPCINTHDAIKVANTLVGWGFTPFIPHLAHFWHTISPKPYEVWTEWDNEWLKVSEAVLRLPGKSPGADAEVKLAESLGIPVYYKMKDLLDVRP